MQYCQESSLQQRKNMIEHKCPYYFAMLAGLSMCKLTQFRTACLKLFSFFIVEQSLQPG